MSNYYGRCYDKYRESRDEAYRKCWRYEVEAKGKGAEATRAFVNAVDAAPQHLAAMVAGWYRDRGVDVRYRPGLADAPAAIGANPTDDIRSLLWLRAAAAPALKRLGERYPRGVLIRWLFDGASMDELAAARAEIERIERTYLERAETEMADISATAPR